MAIVKQYDKRSGITYAYEATYHWDKEKNSLVVHESLLGVLTIKHAILFLPMEDVEKIKPPRKRNLPNEDLYLLHRPNICIMELPIFLRKFPISWDLPVI